MRTEPTRLLRTQGPDVTSIAETAAVEPAFLAGLNRRMQ